MKKILFSIVTTTYNRMESGYLGECIDSVRSQKKGDYDYEHIIVDDGSVDDTKDFMKSQTDKDKRIMYFYQKNAGPAKATQLGLTKAKGDYVIIVDDDDSLTHDSLFMRTEFIKKNMGIDWFYGLAEWIDDFGLPTPPLFQSRFYSDHRYERQLIANHVHSGTPTVKRSAFEKITWPSWLERSQDYFLWLELMRPENKFSVGFIDEILFRYRYHSQNYTAKIDDKKKKQAKNELNFKIKSLHPEPLAFLAQEAFTWVEEAHKTNDFWKKQFETRINPLEKKLAQYEDRLNSYHLSRLIAPIIKFRDHRHKIPSMVKVLPRRVAGKFLRKLNITRDSQIPTEIEVVRKDNRSPDIPLISVITPFYNRQDTMPETVRSVLGQTFQNFEYLIVNDGSTMDEASEYLSKIHHPKIRIINQRNQGVASARNTGISEARGKYILCLDSDDILEPTYIEKALIVLESNPEVSIVTFDTKMFGAMEDFYFYRDYDPFVLIEDNLIQTAAVYKKDAWLKSGGYKDEIGYEDWEFWVNVTEKGFFAKHIKEPIFLYRTAHNSRYIDDQEYHKDNTQFIKQMHPNYTKNIQSLVAEKSKKKEVFKNDEVFLNINDQKHYLQQDAKKPNVLLAIPWMTFGGAETLITNFCKEIANDYNLSFVTGLKSENEWEYKFKEISKNIYHLANLFEDEGLYIEFISNYIKTRNIDILHIIHTSYVFNMLAELKKRHPMLRVIVTVFNDKAHFSESLEPNKCVDIYTTDNTAVKDKYQNRLAILGAKNPVRVIPNGINSTTIFNPQNFDAETERTQLGIKDDDIAVFFIGRLSGEKNPNVFIDTAKAILNKNRKSNIKFFMIGDGIMRKEIQDEINEYGSSRLKYLGYQTDVAKYLSAADIFVLPSSTEGFPLSILEAMAMDTIVIASDVGAVSDVISSGDDGYVVAPGSSAEISKSIEEIRHKPELLAAMKSKARKKVESKYSNAILGDNYRKLYMDALK